MLALSRNCTGASGRRARKPRRWPSLERVVVTQVDATGPHVRMIGRLIRGKHRRKACIGPFEQGAPFVAALADKQFGEAPPLLAPGVVIVLLGKRRIGIQAEPGAQLAIEFRFDRTEILSRVVRQARPGCRSGVCREGR